MCQDLACALQQGDLSAHRNEVMEPALIARDMPLRYHHADLVALLCGIVARVLQLSTVEPDDDFFDLGGDSIMAVLLTVEVRDVTGIQLPTTTLFDAPTVRTLARLLTEREDAIPSSVVRLKPGSGEPALFIAPGAGGSAIELLPLGRRIETAGPVYGLRAPGLAEPEAALDRIEAMAAHYLPLIRAIQPQGPYYIAGYSMGGLIAVEIARLLMRAGEKVALLALLDTRLLPKHLPLSTRIRIWGHRATHHAGQLRRMPLRDALRYAVGRMSGLRSHLRTRARGRRVQETQDRQSWPEGTRRVMAGAGIAVAHYRRRFLPGTITFIEAAEDCGLPLHPEIVWRRHAARLDVLKVEGDHSDMIRRHVDDVAWILSARIRDTKFG